MLLEDVRSLLEDPYFDLVWLVSLGVVYHRAELVDLERISVQGVLVAVFEITCYVFEVVLYDQLSLSKVQTV